MKCLSVIRKVPEVFIPEWVLDKYQVMISLCLSKKGLDSCVFENELLLFELGAFLKKM